MMMHLPDCQTLIKSNPDPLATPSMSVVIDASPLNHSS